MYFKIKNVDNYFPGWLTKGNTLLKIVNIQFHFMSLLNHYFVR